MPREGLGLGIPHAQRTPHVAQGLTPAAIRGSIAIQSAFASDFTPVWPDGTVAGDTAVVFGGNGWNWANTDSWTILDNQGGSNANGAVWSKVLTSEDIETPPSFNAISSFNGVLGGIVFEGSDASPVLAVSLRNSQGTTTESLETGAVLHSDTLVFMGYVRDAANCSVDQGSHESDVNASNASGCVYAGLPAIAASSLTADFHYSAAGNGDYQAIVLMPGH